MINKYYDYASDRAEYYSIYPIEAIKRMLKLCRSGELERIEERVASMQLSPVVKGVEYRITPETEERFWFDAIRDDILEGIRGIKE